LIEEAIAVGAAISATQRDEGSCDDLPEGSQEPQLQLPVEGTPLRVVDTLVVNRGSASARIELCVGDLTTLRAKDAVDDCRKVTSLLTPAYLGSKVCVEEFNIALCRNREANRPILAPIYLYSTQLPTYMKTVQFWDCREFEPTKIDQACKALAQELSTEA